MKQRVFIALELPEKIKTEIESLKQKFKNLKLKWVSKENFHLTLIFLGYLEPKEVEKTKEILKEISQNYSSFLIKLERLALGPDFKRPRMIWILGKTPLVLENLVRDLNHSLKEKGILKKEPRTFLLHLTLARARKNELFGKKIEKKVNFSFLAKKICLFESFLTKEGSIYKPLEKFVLKS